MKRYVTTVALPRKETLLLRSYLSLMHGRTDVEWEYVDSGPADVSVVCADTEDGRRFAAQSRGVCIAYGQRQAADDNGISVAMPIRMGALIQALNRASTLLQGGAAKAAPDKPVQGLANCVFAEILRSLMRAGTTQALVDGMGVTAAIDFKRRTFRLSGPLDSAKCGQPAWTIRRTADAALEPSDEDRPLTQLLWMAGMGEARVGPGMYRLVQWPDLGALPHVPSFVRLAAMFLRQPSSLATAVSASGVPTREVAAFLGASVLAGYAQPIEGGREAGVVGRNGTFGGLVDRIRRRLGL